MEKYEVVVIGGGPAGITLAKMLGSKRRTAVVRPEDYSMIYCAMPYAVEGLLSVQKTLKKDELVTDAGAELIRSMARGIDFDRKTVNLADSTVIAYDKLVLATGANPFLPPIDGIDLNGVMGFKTEKDMKRIIQFIDSGVTRAVVIGAGAIGVELAQALKKRELDVDIIDMAASALPNMIDPEIAKEIEKELILRGINLHLNAKVTALRGTDYVQQIVLDNGEVIDFDELDKCSIAGDDELAGIVVFAAGMRPEVSLVKDSGMEIGRDGIIVNDRMETNIPDVYAVGDCVQFTNGITGKVFSGKLATNAVPMARVLGFNLLGQDRRYPGFYNGSATKVGKYYVGGTGLSESAAKIAGFDTVCAYSQVTSKFAIMPDAKVIRLKLIADNKTANLIGAQVLSEEPVTDRIDLLTFAIQNESGMADLARLSYAAQPYQSCFPAANLIVLAAEDILAKLQTA